MAIGADRKAEIGPSHQPLTPNTGEVDLSTPGRQRDLILTSLFPPNTSNMTILYHWYDRNIPLPRNEIVDLAEARTNAKIAQWQPVDHDAEWISAEQQVRLNHYEERFRGFLNFFDSKLNPPPDTF